MSNSTTIKAPSVKASHTKLVGFRAGPMHFVLDTSHLVSIHQADVLRRATGQDDGAVGTVLTRDAEIPVFDLAGLFHGQTSDMDGRAYILVVRAGQEQRGILVHHVTRPFRAPVTSFRPIPGVMNRFVPPWFDGVVTLSSSNAAVMTTDDPFSLSISPVNLWETPANRPLQELCGSSGSAAGTLAHRSKSAGRILAFQVNDLLVEGVSYSIAFSMMQLVEIMRPQRLMPVPGSNPHFLGIANCRQQPVGVIDLAGLLGLPLIASPLAERLIVVRTAGNTILGFRASAQVRTLSLPIKAESCPSAYGLRNELVHATFMTDAGALVFPKLSELCA